MSARAAEVLARRDNDRSALCRRSRFADGKCEYNKPNFCHCRLFYPAVLLLNGVYIPGLTPYGAHPHSISIDNNFPGSNHIATLREAGIKPEAKLALPSY